MEMVSTAKSKRLTDRRNAAAPYRSSLLELIACIGKRAQDISSPYLHQPTRIRRSALLVVSANRGLCGGYNSNVLRLAHHYYDQSRQKNIDCDLYVIGKKGVAFFTFLKLPIRESYLHIDDNFRYEEAEDLASYFMQEFSHGTYDQVNIATTVYYSAGQQKPEILSLLPVSLEVNAQSEKSISNVRTEASQKLHKLHGQDYVFDPNPEMIIGEMLPLAIKTNLYGILLEAITSEYTARRIAMKNASDAASDMLKVLKRSYNRIRQASITQELAEIVAGADAV